jgi:quercetin dioxygenase-like cupin family protein
MAPEGHVRRPAVSHEDDRGRIVDLFVGEPFDAITHITQRKGAIRGDHFHRETLQIVYVVRGRLRVITQMPGEEVRTETAEAGELIRTPPILRHAFVALEDAELIVFTRGPRAAAAYESDTYRLAESLVTPDRSGPA